jgi:hypothetical protein
MSAPVRGAAFAAILVAVFALASLAGGAIDPAVDAAPEHEEGADMDMATHETEETGAHDTHGSTDTAGALPGLASAEAGYRLIPDRTRFRAEDSATLAFRIIEAGGETVRDFDVEHTRSMHLILVRRDFAGFQHLHPRQRDDGTWVAVADLSDAGVYRAFADFSTGGRSLTLANDVFVAGEFEPVPLPEPTTTVPAGDGYQVEIESDRPRAGEEAAVEFRVLRDGVPLEGVEPYLGADGHLVALREHDQAFLHTHPEGEPGGAGPISFRVSYPSPGAYRLFLQFKDDGKVRTAAFTQVVEEDSHEGG